MLWEMATLAEQPYQGFTNDEVSCGLRHGTRNNQDNLNELMSLEVFIHPLRMIRRTICFLLYFDYPDYTLGKVLVKLF